MLKFLDNRTHEKQKKSPIKYKPEMVYGISAESPTSFQTPYTIVSSQTYINPYLDFEKNRQSKLPFDKTMLIKPQWTRKNNLQMIQEQKIVSSNIQNPLNSPLSRYRKSYKQQFQQSENRFKITRGEFSDFLEKNNRYKSMGPIHGNQRTSERIDNTKKSVWLKSDSASNFSENKILYSTYFDLLKQNQSRQKYLLKNESCISQNSKLISEKSRIRDNRQKMNTTFQKNLQQRKHSVHFKVELPKMKSQILSKYQPYKIKTTNNSILSNQIAELQQFQKKMHRQFK